MVGTKQGAKVAIYWDFENVHASLFDEAHGDGDYHFHGRRRPN